MVSKAMKTFLGLGVVGAAALFFIKRAKAAPIGEDSSLWAPRSEFVWSSWNGQRGALGTFPDTSTIADSVAQRTLDAKMPVVVAGQTWRLVSSFEVLSGTPMPLILPRVIMADGTFWPTSNGYQMQSGVPFDITIPAGAVAFRIHRGIWKDRGGGAGTAFFYGTNWELVG